MNENTAYPKYSSKRGIPWSPGYHVPRHRTKGRNAKGTVNRYQSYKERVGICYKFRDTGYCNFGQKYRSKNVSRFNKSQDRNFSAINQSNTFSEEMHELVTSVTSLVESHRAGGPTMAFRVTKPNSINCRGSLHDQFAQS